MVQTTVHWVNAQSRWKFLELVVAIHYDVIVEDIEKDFPIDASVLHYTQVQVKYGTQELYRKGKAVKGVERIRRAEYRACRVPFSQSS